MTHRAAAAIAAASLLTCMTAHAGVLAEATLTDLQIGLFALDPSRAGAASVSFEVTGGSLARVFAAGAGNAPPVTASMSGGAAFAAVDAADADGTNAGGSARIDGDAFKGGADVTTSAYSNMPGCQSEASAYLGDGDGTATFTLSPHSVLVISVMADLSATGNTALSDYAIASAELEFIGSQGDNSQESLANGLVAAGGTFGAANALHEHLVVSFVNPYDYAINGTFFGGVDTTTAAAVPEPGEAALLLAAFGMFAAMGAMRSRRRQA